MTTTELLALFANPDTLKTLSVSQKFLAGAVTTTLGIGITFSALIALQFIISWMDRLLNRAPSSQDQKVPTPPAEPETNATGALSDDKELIAVITTALAMQLKTTVDNIVIRNLRKIEDRSPLWNQAGIIEQMNSRL